MYEDRLLRVGEVAEILRVSPMTVIRWCDSGHLPCIKIGVSRRIREDDLAFILQSERGPQKPKKPEPRPVYVGPPADQCGFDSEADEVERQRVLKEQCEALKRLLEDMQTNEESIPEPPPPPPMCDPTKRTGKYPSGFDV